MVVEEFFEAVKQMRFAQMRYFTTKNKNDLLTAKTLERRVDALLAERQEKTLRAQLQENT